MMKSLCAALCFLTLLPALFAKDASASGRPRYGGKLTVPLSRAPRPVDPIQVRTPEEIWLCLALFDTLYVFGPTGSPELNLLATEPKISEDKKVFTFTLRPGLTFHDGSPLLAEDVVNSFTRLLGPSASEHAWLLADVSGAREFRIQKAPAVEGLRALSEREFEIVFVKPPDLDDVKARLTAVPTAIVKVSEGGKITGSGPFYRDPKERSQTTLTLLPFMRHAQGRPFLDQLIFKQYSLLDEQVAFVAREVWITFHSPLKESTPKPNLLTGPEVLTDVYFTHKGAFYTGSEEFYEALDAAIDRQVVLKFGLRDLLDSGRPADKLLAKAFSPHASLRGGAYEPALAKKKLSLAGAKHTPPRELEIIYEDSCRGHRGLAEQLREFLADVGAKARGVSLDDSSFLSRLGAGRFDIAVGLIAPVAPGALGLPRMMAAAGDLEGAFTLVARGWHRSRSQAKKKEEALLAAGGLLPVGHRAPAVLYDPRLKGLAFSPIGALDFSRVWIEE